MTSPWAATTSATMTSMPSMRPSGPRRRPVAASGASRICRANPHSDGRERLLGRLQYTDGLVHNHYGQALANFVASELSCRVCSEKANTMVHYSAKAQFRSPDQAYSVPVENLYEAGAVRNIEPLQECHRRPLRERDRPAGRGWRADLHPRPGEPPPARCA